MSKKKNKNNNIYNQMYSNQPKEEGITDESSVDSIEENTEVNDEISSESVEESTSNESVSNEEVTPQEPQSQESDDNITEDVSEEPKEIAEEIKVPESEPINISLTPEEVEDIKAVEENHPVEDVEKETLQEAIKETDKEIKEDLDLEEPVEELDVVPEHEKTEVSMEVTAIKDHETKIDLNDVEIVVDEPTKETESKVINQDERPIKEVYETYKEVTGDKKTYITLIDKEAEKLNSDIIKERMDKTELEYTIFIDDNGNANIEVGPFEDDNTAKAAFRKIQGKGLRPCFIEK